MQLLNNDTKIKVKKKLFFPGTNKWIISDNLFSVVNRVDHIKCTTLTLSSNCNSLKDNIDLDKGEKD